MVCTALLSVLLAGTAVNVPASGLEPTSAPMLRAMEYARAPAILSDVEFIASDEMQGRDTPSEGLRITARYLKARMQRLGWQPGARDGWFQTYELANKRLDAAGTQAVLSHVLDSGTRTQTLAFGADLYLSSPFVPTAGSAEGDAVWLGVGSSAAFDAGDWKDRVGFVSEPADQGERQKVFSRARSEGLKAVVLVAAAGDDVGERLAARTKRLVAGSPRYVPPSDSGEESRGQRPNRVAVTNWHMPRASFDRACTALGLDTSTLGEEARELKLRWNETRVVDATSKVTVENVVGFWPGSDPVLSKETILISAHYDHVGVTDGQVYNGADDNGSGTSGLLALAEVLANHGPLRRSVAMIWVSGEEKGLWGSQAWAAEPWLPGEAKAVANINMDMIGRNAPDDLMVTPTTKLDKHFNGLGLLADQLSPLEGFPKLRSADEYWSRSDHASFAKLGIPVMFLFADVHADYHKPGDDVEKIDADKIRRVVRLVSRIVDAMQGETLLPPVK